MLDEYTLIKTQVNEYYDELAKGAMIRSRCQQIHESEKPTKYFFSLEKVKYNIKHIRSLKHNGKHLFDPQKILDLQKVIFRKFILKQVMGTQCLNWILFLI